MFCDRTKEFLSRLGVTFTERDITRDHSALEELQRLGVMTTPVTVAGDETVIGYDEPRLTKLVKEHEQQGKQAA